MVNNIRPEVYKRIVFAKWLQQQGDSAISNAYDQMQIAKGILLLHDAVEAAFGAIADHLNVHLSGNIYLLQYYELICKGDPKNRKVPYQKQMRTLNTLRNNVKHEGIFPEYKTVAHLPATVHSLLEEICSTYLSVELDSISLVSLINDGPPKNHIIEAEKFIKKSDYEKALISLAYAIFYIAESSTLGGGIFASLLKKEDDAPEYEFTKPYGTDYTVKLLQHGVDPYTYYRFRNLTPRIARHKKTREIYYRWEKDYGHAGNWNRRNAQFCLWFTIDTALKFQRKNEYGYEIKHYLESFVDIIEPTGEEAIIWNVSEQLTQIQSNPLPTERKEIFRLKKGEKILGYVSDREDLPNEWFVVSKNFQKESESTDFGYVNKNDVKITQISIDSE